MAGGVTGAAIRVLGPFEASVNGACADLGGPRQRAVLARLAAAHGQMVPAERLIDELWPGEAPPRAAAGLQSFVSHLRRALEPDRPPRTPAEVLVTSPPGYALRLPIGNVDAWRFDTLVDEAGEFLAAADPATARLRADAALGEWRGPAYAEFAELSWAVTEAGRLEERHRLAVERRAEAMLRLGAATEAVPDLEAHAAANPMREEAWRLLALALYRAGRQGDALGALRRARATLADELGVDPGPALRRLEADILAQAPELDPQPAPMPPTPTTPPTASTAPMVSTPLQTAPPLLRLVPEPAEEAPAGPLFVGRADELARLAAAAQASAAGRCTVALVSGEAGMGKTSLIERFGDTLGGEGWTCAWGSAPETGGAPAAWPWAELLRELAAADPPEAELARTLGPLLGDAVTGLGADATTARFRLHLAVADYLGALSEKAPLLLVLDDLHWADDETLAVLTGLPARLRGRPVLVVGTFRQTEISDRLATTLATLARQEPLRIELAGLAPDEVARLVRDVCVTEVGEADLAGIAERTGGNPFFTRETARLLDAEGMPAAARGVPAGVGDVLRRHIARLPEDAQSILRNAAVVGRDVDLAVLTEVSGGDEDAVIEAVEAGLAGGLIVEPAAGRIRFGHALVRDTLYGELSRIRRTRIHGRVAAALERWRPGEIAALAHHFLAAGDEPAKAVRYARLAAEAAEARFAHGTAAELLVRAADLLRARDSESLRELLETEVDAIHASALAGLVVAARERRWRAIAEARAFGDLRLLGRIIVSYDVPTLWTSHVYGTVDHDAIEAAEEALAGLGDDDEELRIRLLTSLAIELEGDPDERGAEASVEAVRRARRLGRPDLLAVALNGRFLNAFRTADDLAERRRISAEILELATAHDLGLYQVLGHLQMQSASFASLDLAAAREHLEVGRRLADQYGLPLLGLIASWYDAIEHVFAARPEAAERAYSEVGDAIGRTGIWSSERGMEMVGVFCVRLSQGRAGELVDAARWIWQEWPHVGAAADLYAIALIEAGRTAEARRVVADAGPVRPDFFFDLVMSIRGLRAIALDEHELAADVYERLLPYEGHVSGGACTVASVGPVAHILGDLAVFLGRPGPAAGHYRRAAEVAERIGAQHWAEAARTALAALGHPAA
ncbi:BTAD domain-containing putative transcriptional regulator [Actinomadura rudentiformis]|uniref:AAA family ATPase n=1 Tax=Actinomadura rudentiformis TaxID=359158 RepID=A0A6H9YX26_9ACTN|nr:BTAD domain-containing putative transcriptional regulator [Actinomadura rudentiformis]KAB2345591.1 AAA family ATPase [Actinomadura rudentiformis]